MRLRAKYEWYLVLFFIFANTLFQSSISLNIRMKIRVQNLGKIREAEVDLSKKLILFTGQNNTGKTYLTYAIYGVMTQCDKFLRTPSEAEFAEKLLDGERDIQGTQLRLPFDVVMDTFFYNYDNVSDVLSNTFNNKIDNAKIELMGNYDLYNFQSAGISTGGIAMESFEGKKYIVFYSKDLSKFYLGDIIELIEMLIEYNFSIIYSDRCFIFPTERNAINLFSKELALNKNNALERIVKNPEALEDIKRKINRYPKPVQDALKIAEDLANLSKRTSKYAYLADELEASIMGGKVGIDSYGGMVFTPNDSQTSLENHMTSSLVKSLSSLAFYLRHQAEVGDYILIDEPELNLHPDNQRKVARFMARLVNEGFHVIASTHSDYIIKELNLLTMLGNPTEEAAALRKDINYNDNEMLTPDDISVLFFQQGKDTPEQLTITETGFSVPTIDKTMQAQDNLTERVYYKLFEK